MAVLDIGICLAALLAFLLGWKFRAINAFFLFLALVAGALAARHLAPQLVDSFRQFSPATAQILAWLVPFVVAVLLILFLGGVVSGWCDTSPWKWLDRMLGAVLACYLMLILITLGLSALSGSGPVRPRWMQESRMAEPVVHWAQPVIDRTRRLIPEIEKTLAP